VIYADTDKLIGVKKGYWQGFTMIFFKSLKFALITMPYSKSVTIAYKNFTNLSWNTSRAIKYFCFRYLIILSTILGGTSGRVAKRRHARRRSDGRQRPHLGRTLRRKRKKLVGHRHGAGDKVSVVKIFSTIGRKRLF
jgi:hypothetical protein